MSNQDSVKGIWMLALVNDYAVCIKSSSTDWFVVYPFEVLGSWEILSGSLVPRLSRLGQTWTDLDPTVPILTRLRADNEARENALRTPRDWADYRVQRNSVYNLFLFIDALKYI